MKPSDKTKAATTPTPKPDTAPKGAYNHDPNNPKIHEVRLVSPKKGEMLRFRADQMKDGSYSFYGFHNLLAADGKLQAGKGRGATQSFADFATAKAAVDKAVAKAIELGWTRPVAKRGGGGRRPDSFDLKSLPTPTN